MLHWRLKLVQRCGLCCESRGWEEMNFERSVNLRGRNASQELDWYSKSFQLWEPYFSGAQSWTFLRIFMRWASRLWLLWSAVQVLLGHPCTWLHQQLSVELAISLLGWKKHLDIIVTYLKLQVSISVHYHYLRGAASGVHLCWPSSHRMTNWGAPEWIFWIQQVVELVVVRQLDNVW